VGKNHELLGMRLTYDMRENVSAIISQWNPAFWQDISVNNAKELACRAHLGYAKGKQVGRIVEEGADWAVEYFRKGETRKFGWYKLFFHGLLLCLILNDRARIERLCQWARPTRKPDYNPILPDEMQLFCLCVASLFQKNPAPGFESLAAKVAATRNKEIRLLSRAFDAVRKSDPIAFEKAILECIKFQQTKPRPEPDAYFMEDWLPLHANLVYLAGLQSGLKAPKYPAKVSAYLMTPESVGIGRKA
jgi:hypothetical protein